MAQLPKHRKYLTLEDVRVSYDPKSDSILLTSGDRELKSRGGFKLDLRQSNSTGKVLRELLRDKGLIEGEPWPKQYSNDFFNRLLDPTDSGKVLLGTDVQGENVYWDAAEGSLFIYGQPGSGTSVIPDALLCHCVQNGWRFYGLDMLQELEGLRARSKTVKQIASGLIEVERTLTGISDLIEERTRRMVRTSMNRPLVKDESTEIALVFINDLLEISEALASTDSRYSFRASNIISMLKNIGLSGALLGFHLVVADRSGSSIEKLHRLKSDSSRLVIGRRADPNSGHRARYSHLERAYPTGRGVLTEGDQRTELELFDLKPEDRDLWIQSQQDAISTEI